MSTAGVARNKAAVIERCVKRARQVWAGAEDDLVDDPTKQDSIILNLQRACEAAVDLAMHLVRVERLGVPRDSRQAFDLLAAAGRIERHLDDLLAFARVGLRAAGA